MTTQIPGQLPNMQLLAGGIPGAQPEQAAAPEQLVPAALTPPETFPTPGQAAQVAAVHHPQVDIYAAEAAQAQPAQVAAQPTPALPVPPAGYSMLPTGYRIEKNCLSHATILIYGAEKVGKSTTASLAPNPLYVPTERGIGFLNCQPIQNADGTTKVIEDWQELNLLRAEIDQMRAHGIEIPYDTLVIDTLDNLWDIACKRVSAEHGVSDVAEVGDYSLGYRKAGMLLKDLLQWSAGLSMGNIFCGHAKEMEIADRYGKTTKWGLKVSQSAAKHFLAAFDIILFMENEPAITEDGMPSERRVFRCRGSRNWIAGDRSNRLPETLVVPDEPTLMYEALDTAFKLGPFPKRSTFDYELYLQASQDSAK